MTLSQIFQQHIEKAKRYIELQNKGMGQVEAAYRVYGVEVGDQFVKMRQHEIIINISLN